MLNMESAIKDDSVLMDYINTFQRKTNGSINGCTVIAKLMGIRYLDHGSVKDSKCSTKNSDKNITGDVHIDRSIPNDVMVEIIDKLCVQHLRKIIQKENLGLDELISPICVTSYFVDHNIMKHISLDEETYGGNIFDATNASRWTNALMSHYQEGYKCGLMFFNEHVIRISCMFLVKTKIPLKKV